MSPDVLRNRDPVPPVPRSTRSPKWSVMIPTYNSAQYLSKTLQSVLSQAPGPEYMQIEVVDDCSWDNPEKVVTEVGGGRVGFFRQSKNAGHIANFQSCLVRSRGELVHLLHGDDAVRPGFYRQLQSGFDTSVAIGAAFCRSIFVDAVGTETGIADQIQREAGVVNDAAIQLALEQRIMTPSIAVRRSVYELLGGFDRRLKCAEDWEMWVKIASQFQVWYEPEPLALYRIHPNSNTGRHIRSAEDVAYNRMAITIFEAYLPRDRAAEIVASARRTYALSAIDRARDLLERGDWAGCLAQLREGLRLELFDADDQAFVAAVSSSCECDASAR